MTPVRSRSSCRTFAAGPTRTSSTPTACARQAGTSSDLPELGLRVSVTRCRYPNRPDGIDQYAVTLSRPELDRPPGNQEVEMVLVPAFGAAAARAVERSGGSSRIRMFRVPAGVPDGQPEPATS